MAVSVQVVMDCADPRAIAKFWAELLGYQEQPPPPGFDSWPAFLKAQNIPEDQWDGFNAVVDPEGKGPRIFFQRVPEGKTVKNRVHLDVNVGGGYGAPEEERKRRIAEAAEKVIGLGGKQLREMNERGEYWRVMQDPEGNEFCLQ